MSVSGEIHGVVGFEELIYLIKKQNEKYLSTKVLEECSTSSDQNYLNTHCTSSWYWTDDRWKLW